MAQEEIVVTDNLTPENLPRFIPRFVRFLQEIYEDLELIEVEERIKVKNEDN